MIITEIARYLHNQGLGVFDETGVAGNIFIATMPNKPDHAIALFPTGGYPSSGTHGYDEPTFQVLVRGGLDPRAPMQKAQDIYDALHGLHHTELPGGTWVIGCLGIQSGPVAIGKDQSGRHEFSLNFAIEVRSLTMNRE